MAVRLPPIISLFLAGFITLLGCTLRPDPILIDGQDVEVTFLHTGDIHSRLIPYTMDVGEVDKSLGLLPDNAPFGGISRLSALARQLRRDNERYAHVDTGDVFQGAPIFNEFGGEPEFRALSHLGIDAMAIGNHEFDNGATFLVERAMTFAHFPMLAANYTLENPDFLGGSATARIAQPYTILNLKGLRVGVIGLGNLASMGSVFKGGNSQGITPRSTVPILQWYIDYLRPQVDLVISVGHLGYHDNLDFVPRTEGLDLVFDGHLHIALDPPNVVSDCDISKLEREKDRYKCDTEEKLRQDARSCEVKAGCDDMTGTEKQGCIRACYSEAVTNCNQLAESARFSQRLHELEEDIERLKKRDCHPRDVPLIHSGAFLKYAGVFKATLRQCTRLAQTEVCTESDHTGTCTKKVSRRCVGRNGGRDDWEVVSHRYDLVPIDSRLPQDPSMLQLMEPYQLELAQQQLLTQVVGFTPNAIKRFSTGSGDSQLGNLVADSMQLRNQVWADFSVTNSLGIRSDMVIGPVDREQMTNVFPFENAITVMYLSGLEVQEMMDFIAQRSTNRGCQSQAQVGGITAVLNCGGCPAMGENECAQQPYDGEACAQRITIGGSGQACSAPEVGDKECPLGEICTGQRHPIESDKYRCWLPLTCTRSYRLATNDYIARGGSGFKVLERNTTQVNLGISLRQGAIDSMLGMPSCGEYIPRKIVKDTATGEDKHIREFVVSDEDEAELKGMELVAVEGDWATVTASYNAIRAKMQSRLDASTDNRLKVGLTNYLACMDDCQGENSTNNCRGLARVEVERCLAFNRCLQSSDCDEPDPVERQKKMEQAQKDVGRCEAIARIRAALRCVTLPCIDSQEDGRLQRVFQDTSGSPNPYEPWPE
jgi:5'-nucleotidase / UDP-sugar diphosphatase